MRTLPDEKRRGEPWPGARLALERTVDAANDLGRDRPIRCAQARSLFVRFGEDVESLTRADARRCAEVARRLYHVLAETDRDRAALGINSLLADFAGPPRLSRHDGAPWHVHVDRHDDSAWHEWLGATGALALALCLDRGLDRAVDAVPWGSCAAPGCSRVFVHDGRGEPRRYCSTTCATRVRVAEHRRRGRAS